MSTYAPPPSNELYKQNYFEVKINTEHVHFYSQRRLLWALRRNYKIKWTGWYFDFDAHPFIHFLTLASLHKSLRGHSIIYNL